MNDYAVAGIQEAIQAVEYTIAEMTVSQSILLHEKVSQKFADGKEYESLFWEAVGSQGFSVRDREAWKWLDEFLQGQQFLLFFEKTSTPIVYAFQEHQIVSKFLKECPIYVFYITNQNLDYLIYFNDSDYLRCIGTAEPWLQNKARELSQAGWRDRDERTFLP
ncbi:MAG: hypothetical protein AAF518_21600 [Spirochaetota bacterium]